MNPSIEEAVKELKRITEDPDLREQAFRRQLALMDKIAEIQGAKEEGIAEGIVQGISQGTTLANERAARRLLQAGIAIPIIAGATSLSEERVMQLAKEAERPS